MLCPSLNMMHWIGNNATGIMSCLSAFCSPLSLRETGGGALFRAQYSDCQFSVTLIDRPALRRSLELPVTGTPSRCLFIQYRFEFLIRAEWALSTLIIFTLGLLIGLPCDIRGWCGFEFKINRYFLNKENILLALPAN